MTLQTSLRHVLNHPENKGNEGILCGVHEGCYVGFGGKEVLVEWYQQLKKYSNKSFHAFLEKPSRKTCAVENIPRKLEIISTQNLAKNDTELCLSSYYSLVESQYATTAVQ